MPYASATFPWFLLGRQVHVRGPVTKVSAEQTADYWSKRPRGSQLGAWASHQSQPIASRDALLEQLADVTRAFRRPRRGSGAAELGRVPHRARGRRVLAGPGEPGAQQDSCRHRGPHRAVAALGAAALRRHHTAADARLPPAVAGGHRHRHRRQPDDLRGAGAALRAHPELGLRRAVRPLRARAADRVRAVGRRAGPTRWTVGCC